MVSFCLSSGFDRKRGVTFWLNGTPPVISFVGSLATVLNTAVGPFLSIPWLGERPSARGSFAFLPSGVASVPHALSHIGRKWTRFRHNRCLLSAPAVSGVMIFLYLVDIYLISASDKRIHIIPHHLPYLGRQQRFLIQSPSPLQSYSLGRPKAQPESCFYPQNTFLFFARESAMLADSYLEAADKVIDGPAFFQCLPLPIQSSTRRNTARRALSPPEPYHSRSL